MRRLVLALGLMLRMAGSVGAVKVYTVTVNTSPFFTDNTIWVLAG